MSHLAALEPATAPITPRTARRLRILFVTSAHNSLSQRALVALTELGHQPSGAAMAA